ALAARLAIRVASGVASTRPRPKVGVGMRKITLLPATWEAKFGCPRLQPGASVRPAMVNKSWTPPSSGPVGLAGSLGLVKVVDTKRASRTGPLAVMKEGTVLRAPSRVANATCGLGTGCIL